MSRDKKRKGGVAAEALTFQWVVPETNLWRLIFYGAVTVLAVGGFFFIFRVVYPESKREPLVSRRVLVLSEKDPAARALIQRAVDQSFALLPSPGVETAEKALLPAFSPSFAGYRMRLKGLPPSSIEEPRSSLLTPGRVVLPPIERTKQVPSEEVTPPGKLRLWVRVSGPAGERLVESHALDDAPLAEPAKLRYRVGINEQGRVIFALALESIEDAATQLRLQQVVEHLRFRPMPDAGMMWAQATFEWQEDVAP